MSNTLERLSALQFPGETAQQHNQNLRDFLREVAPLVEKGSINSIKNSIRNTLDLPLDDSEAFASAHFWAINESWPYIHWDRVDKPIPPERQLMKTLYRQVMNGGVWPIELSDEGSVPAKEKMRG